MAFEDRGGGKHTNHSSFKSAEAKLKSKGPSATPQGGADMQGGQDEGDMQGGQDGKAMAQQHGPALQLSIDHTSGHKVHAMHQDGHEHESEHGSAAEAHQFAGDCAGGGMQ